VGAKIFRTVVLTALLAAATTTARTAEVEKRWRIGATVGGEHTSDEVRSDAANLMELVDPARPRFRDFYEDPRNDAAAIGTLTIEPSFRLTIDTQYAFTKIFLLQTSVGYQAGEVGKIELQGMLDGDFFDMQREQFNFRAFRLTAGDIVQVPIQLTAVWRFRPKTTFNPFFGVGGGYTFVSFDPSDDLDTLSAQLDGVTGGFVRQVAAPGSFDSPGPEEPLSGAQVEADGFLEYHVDGGFEYAFAKKWAFVFDLKWTVTNGTFRLRFNGDEQLGISVPNGEFDLQSPEGQAIYGTYDIRAGLWDGGCFVRSDAVTQEAFVCVPPDQIATVCQSLDPRAPDCQLRFPGPNQVPNPTDPTGQPITLQLNSTDGAPDAGKYYVRGGDIRYGGPSVHLGVRFTF